MESRLARIWIKRVTRGPMDAVETARAVAGCGLVGNANWRGRRQVTLLSSEEWNGVTARFERPPEPHVRRANLLLTGIRLHASRGRVLRVGEIRIRILGETRPCERMEEAHRGLREALTTPWGGGAFGELLTDGKIMVGDAAAWE